jgi:uncharacterized alkaline shock family protein YloU
MATPATTPADNHASEEAVAISSTGASGTVATRPRESHTELVTDMGRTSIADSVVRKIAGIATREVSGVYELGTGGTRAFGSIRQRIPGSAGPNVAQGVAVEVGERQAAIDLDVVVEYGVSIVDLSHAIRRNVIASVERMTGLEVTEVNIAVDDIYLGDSEPDDRPARVQ